MLQINRYEGVLRVGAVRVLSPGGSVGYGVNAQSLAAGVEQGLDVICSDSGSVDFGAYYLGSGQPYHSASVMRRDLALLLEAALTTKVPLIIGTAGSAGAREHVEWARAIVEDIARERGYSFRLATVGADQSKDYVLERLESGAVSTFAGAPTLTRQAVLNSTHLVAQMGIEPIVEAVDGGAQVVLAGRACDSGVFAALPVMRGHDMAAALHMGKILECGALSADPPTGRDCLVGELSGGQFEVTAPNPARRVTPYSLAAHMVYEVEDPWLQGEPWGTLDLSDIVSSYNAETRSTTVRGAKLSRSQMPTLKFEGAECVGYRSLLIGGSRDPDLIAVLDDYLEGCENEVRSVMPGDYRIEWIVYGRDGVLGKVEPMRSSPAHEVGLMAQVLASSQEEAHDVAAVLEARMIGFAPARSRTRTAHVAFPLSQIVIDTGPVYRFSVMHIVTLRSSSELRSLFDVEYAQIGGARR